MIDDPQFGSWVLALMDMVAETSACILQEVYDQFRLRALSRYMVRFSRYLDLLQELGLRPNV